MSRITHVVCGAEIEVPQAEVDKASAAGLPAVDACPRCGLPVSQWDTLSFDKKPKKQTTSGKKKEGAVAKVKRAVRTIVKSEVDHRKEVDT